MTRVKICGLTNFDDARAAAEAGADLLGFNFYRPSARHVEPEVAAEIIARLKVERAAVNVSGTPVGFVGVFVNAPLEVVQSIQLLCGLDLVQLHGDEPPAYVCALGVRAFKALRPQSAEQARTGAAEFSAAGGASEPRFLIDTSHPHLYGGTGATGDWSVAAEIASQHCSLLAGGLTASNVASAIRTVRPWGVDVASGVERAPGLKDAAQVRRFIQHVRETI